MGGRYETYLFIGVNNGRHIELVFAQHCNMKYIRNFQLSVEINY